MVCGDVAGRRTLDTKRWSWRRNSTQIIIWRGEDASRWLMPCAWPSGKSKSGSRTGGWSWRRRYRPSKNWTNKKNKLRRKRQLQPPPAMNEEASCRRRRQRLTASFSSKLYYHCAITMISRKYSCLAAYPRPSFDSSPSPAMSTCHVSHPFAIAIVESRWPPIVPYYKKKN